MTGTIKETVMGEVPAMTVCGPDAGWELERQRLEEVIAGAYRERSQLLALVAVLLAGPGPGPVLAPVAADDPMRWEPDAERWRVLYVSLRGRSTVTWHVHPRDLDLFGHVEEVGAGDARAVFDGHSTAEKYERIRRLVAELAR